MVLDFKPALVSILTTFCTISLKLVDARSCYSILTMIESLRSSEK